MFAAVAQLNQVERTAKGTTTESPMFILRIIAVGEMALPIFDSGIGTLVSMFMVLSEVEESDDDDGEDDHAEDVGD